MSSHKTLVIWYLVILVIIDFNIIRIWIPLKFAITKNRLKFKKNDWYSFESRWGKICVLSLLAKVCFKNCFVDKQVWK